MPKQLDLPCFILSAKCQKEKPKLQSSMNILNFFYKTKIDFSEILPMHPFIVP